MRSPRKALIGGLCVALIAVLAAATDVGAQRASLDLAGAIDAYDAGRIEEALPSLEAYAADDADAAFRVGRSYYEGAGAPADLERAAAVFRRSAELGDVNAPVWAGQAYETIGDYEAATEMHRLGASRGLHISSAAALARYHRLGLLPNSNAEAAVRYSAAAQIIFDRAGLTGTDYLDGFSCFDLAKGLFVEEQAESPSPSPDGLQRMTEQFFACSRAQDVSELSASLLAAVAARLDRTGTVVIDETLSIFSFAGGGALPDGVSFIPPPFRGYVAFASDADSAETATALSAHRFLNDRLGLPIASSVFPLATPRQSAADVAAGLRYTAFFRTPQEPDASDVLGLPNAFQLARTWHRGGFDHIHSWYDGGETVVLRPAAARLADAAEIDLRPFAQTVATTTQASDGILRLYFSARPPEDLSVAFLDDAGRQIAVNTAELQFHSRMETDDNVELFVAVLPFPVAPPAFVAAPDGATALEDMVALRIGSESCTASACDTTLTKIEADAFDRDIALAQARWMAAMNVFPYAYTSHGGEIWALHDDPATYADRSAALAAATAQTDTPIVSSGTPLANIPHTKGYLEDLLTRLGVRAVRPQRLPSGLPTSAGQHDWSEDAPLLGLYADKMLFSTTAFLHAQPAAIAWRTQAEFLARELLDFAGLVRTGCTTPSCSVEHTPLLAALIGASFQRAKAADHPFFHAWYTHFGAATPSFAPSVAQPFPDDARDAFGMLAQAQYGFDAAGAATTLPRVLVRPSSTVVRAHKLADIAGSGLIAIARTTSTVEIAEGLDPYLSRAFPAPGHVGRDLAGLTVAVDDAADATVTYDGAPVRAFTRTRGSDGASDTITIVDDETGISLVGADLGANGVPAPLTLTTSGSEDEVCAPLRRTAIYNPTHASFGVSGPVENATVSIRMRPHPQLAYGLDAEARERRIVFSTRPDAVDADDGLGGPVHRVVLPADLGGDNVVFIDLATPERVTTGADRTDIGHAAGIVEEICVETSAAATLGPFRFYRPTTSDFDVRPDASVAIGGQLTSGPEGQEPFALSFEPFAPGETATITAGDGFYVGRLPAPGAYRVRVVAPTCGAEDDAVVELIEVDSLDLDFARSGCSLSRPG